MHITQAMNSNEFVFWMNGLLDYHRAMPGETKSDALLLKMIEDKLKDIKLIDPGQSWQTWMNTPIATTGLASTTQTTNTEGMTWSDQR